MSAQQREPACAMVRQRKPGSSRAASAEQRPWPAELTRSAAARQPWHRPNEKTGLSLREAMFHFGPQDLAESVWWIELHGFHEPYMLIGEDGWPVDPAEIAEHRLAHIRWERQRPELEAALIGRLKSGELYATGFSPLAPIDQPAARIAADRWRILIPDLARSQASGPGGVIEGILVFSTAAQTAGLQGRYSAPALREWYRNRVSALEEEGREPSRDQDWADARAEFGPRVTREVIRALRRELAPASWQRFGRRKRER